MMVNFIYLCELQYTMTRASGVWLKLNGYGGDLPDSYFDPKQLAIGTKVEMEHTSDPAIAKMICKTHLSEFSNYYRYLSVMEQEMKNEEKVREIFGW
jgi:hypothetical protein